MNIEAAKNLLGDRASWELSAMRKALSMIPILNTDEDNLRLEAVKVMQKARNSQKKKAR